MRDAERLRSELERIDGRGYKAYGDLKGAWRLGDFTLEIDHVQGDPFATPSRLRVRLTPPEAGLPGEAFRSRSRRVGAAAVIARTFAERARARSRSRGTGRSGQIRMVDPGQVVLPQTALQLEADGTLEARFVAGLPARGRRIAGSEATELLLEDVPGLVRSTLLAGAHDVDVLTRHAEASEDADHLRGLLLDLGLVAFIADGSSLPRRTGVDDGPLEGEEVVLFESPDALAVEVDLPNRGRVRGMGVPEGVTLIVGGGFHGKSTVLGAIQNGVYNHPPGDGRELAVSRPDAVKVRAEDGRHVAGVDISAFIDGLPLGRRTDAFSTPNASGSTSQAAGIVEAIEAGAGVLLLDEDTSATNFMIRDRRMQTLVPAEGEPITPFIDRVRALHADHDVSTVVVIGGSGDYLDVADTVIRLADYRPRDVSDRAREVAAEIETGRLAEHADPLRTPTPRCIRRESLDPRRGRRARNVKVPDDRTLVFGRTDVDLVAVEQIVHRAQSRAIGLALAWLAIDAPGNGATVPELLDAVEASARESLDHFDPYRTGELMAFRRFELAAALNRVRGLRVDQASASPDPSL